MRPTRHNHRIESADKNKHKLGDAKMNTQSQPRPWRKTALAATLLAGTSLGGFALGHSAWADNNAPVNPTGAEIHAHALPDFTDLVAQVKPAVVSIATTFQMTPAAFEQERGDRKQDGQMPQSPFPFNQMAPDEQPQRKHAVEALGSGFIISADGIIVTNNHVVKNAKTVSVTLTDGTILPAKVIGTDPRTDIAVLKVKASHPLTFIQLGDSRDVKPGEWVVAMGNPFGLGGTVTAGIVSAVSRDIGAGPYDQFIQVDAPINKGNSGGPLFTQDGKVIGMNTAIYSPTGGSVGIGFAIPSDMIRTVSAQLEKSGHMTRGYIGVEAQQITPSTAQAMHLKTNDGALLAGIQSDGPAAEVGLQPGDVIQSVNDAKITNPRELALDVAGIEPGGQAHLSVLHDGQMTEVTVKVGTLPNEQAASNDAEGAGQHHGQLGLALAALSPGDRDQHGVPDGTTGALVQGVQPGHPPRRQACSQAT
jgi:serine protease Do